MYIICKNDEYPEPVLEFYRQLGIDYPKKDEMYEIREVQFHSTGGTGIRVKEIVNPQVDVRIGNSFIEMEPSFDYKRFCDLEGNKLDSAELIQKYR